jgi:hypothetical protein
VCSSKASRSDGRNERVTVIPGALPIRRMYTSLDAACNVFEEMFSDE